MVKAAKANRRVPRRGLLILLCILLCALLLASCSSAPATITPVPPAPPADAIIATPIPSTGCGKPAPVPLGRSVDQAVYSGGLSRTYLLHLPRGYQDTAGTALVLNFHGRSSSAAEQEQRSGFSPLADQQGFIAVYPQGLPGARGATGWTTTASAARQANDVLFVSDLLNQLQEGLCIDSARIYATGFSNGGGMTNLLACTLAGRVAAFAPVSGSYPPPLGGCQPVRSVPLLEIHGTADTVVPYNGNSKAQYPPVLSWLQGWAARDGCTGGPGTFYQQGRVTGLAWTGCQGDGAVIHYRLAAGGHVWPVATFNRPDGTTNHAVNAAALIWSFFQQHPLPPTLLQHLAKTGAGHDGPAPASWPRPGAGRT